MSENLGKGDRNLNCDVILQYLKVIDLLFCNVLCFEMGILGGCQNMVTSLPRLNYVTSFV